jgi:hypothetical protein
MTASTGETALVGLGERIGTMRLLRDALARVRARPSSLVVLWLVLSVADAGLDRGARIAGVDPGAPSSSPDWPFYALADAALDGLGAAAALRLILQGRLWLDRSFAECAGLLAFSGLVVLVLMGRLEGLGLGAGLAVLSGVVATLYVTLKLAIWPVARLTGRGEVTPMRSWRLMNRATRGLLLATIVFLIPLLVVAVAQDGVVTEDSLAEDVIDAVSSQAFAIFSTALVASVYVLRVENPATVADVFD